MSVAPASRPLAFALKAMQGRWLAEPAAGARFAGAAVDSRRVKAGQLFFALPGERVDGFDYCAQAAQAGAAAVVVKADRGIPTGVSVPVIGVSNPAAALADLAGAIRAEFSGTVVGVTGSNGKTTTKELCAAALSAAGRVLKTEGNFNTEIGLPLTILSAAGDERFWVLEMAMRGRGQIAHLAGIANPHIGVITNVAGAHLELLGSIEEVARAKGELFLNLKTDGIAVLPAADPLIEPLAQHLPERRKLRFAGEPATSTRPPADVEILEIIGAGATGSVVRYAVRRQPVVARLPLAGAHNAKNGAAALAVALAAGVPAPTAAAALQHTKLPEHRSAPLALGGRIVLDDCYNANPASMRAALDAVAAGVRYRGRAFAILGDMLELGHQAAEQHHEVGREAGTKLAGLAVVGPLAAELARGAREAGLAADRVFATDDPVAAAAMVARWSEAGDWILVKASRGMRLERAIAALGEEFRAGPPVP